MEIVAFDPGTVTGVAVGRVFERSLSVYTLAQLTTQKICKAKNLIDLAEEVVIEQPFNSGPQMCMDVFEIYGFLFYYAKSKQKTTVKSQPSSLEFARKRFPDIKMSEHWGDALSHLILHCYRQHEIREVKVYENALLGSR